MNSDVKKIVNFCSKCKNNEANITECGHRLCCDCMFCFACPICNRDIFPTSNFFFPVINLGKDIITAKLKNDFDAVYFSDLVSQYSSIRAVKIKECVVAATLSDFEERNIRYVCLRKIVCSTINGVSLVLCSHTFVDIQRKCLFEFDQTTSEIFFVKDF